MATTSTISVRMTEDLSARVKALAAADLRSVNSEVIVLLEEAMAARKAKRLVNA